MNSKQDIEQLITNLLDESLAPGEKLSPTIKYDSSKTAAAKARNQFIHLERDAIPFVKQLILTEKKKNRRNEAYSILTFIAKKYKDSALIYFLIEQLKKEKSQSFISLNLCSIYWSDLSLSKNSEIVLELANHKNSHVRHSAIQVLGLYIENKVAIESFLIDLLNSTTNEYDIYYTNITLQKTGSKNAIETLKKVILSNKRTDILVTAIYAIDIIDGENQVNFFLDMMKEKKDSLVKSTLTESITKHADERAIDIIIDRIKKILSRKRNRNMHYGDNQFPEIVHAIIYLNKFEHSDNRIPKLKKWIIDKKMSFLDDTETIWMNKNLKSIQY